jgi:hypothetical protein
MTGAHLDRWNVRRTALTLMFLPALYAIWFKIEPAQETIGSEEITRDT